MAKFEIRQSRIRSCAIRMENISQSLKYQRMRIMALRSSDAVKGTGGELIRRQLEKQAEEIAMVSSSAKRMKDILELCALTYERCERDTASMPVTGYTTGMAYREISLGELSDKVRRVAKIVF